MHQSLEIPASLCDQALRRLDCHRLCRKRDICQLRILLHHSHGVFVSQIRKELKCSSQTCSYCPCLQACETIVREIFSYFNLLLFQSFMNSLILGKLRVFAKSLLLQVLVIARPHIKMRVDGCLLLSHESVLD